MTDWIFSKGRYSVTYLKDKNKLPEIQNLRFNTYREEFNTDYFDNNGGDIDEYDEYYSHLIVIDNEENRIVGTYRMACVDENTYFGKNFKLDKKIEDLFPQTIEMGRLAIEKNHRNGLVMLFLFKGIGNFLQSNNKRYLIGAGSIPIPKEFTYEKFLPIANHIVKEIGKNGENRLKPEQIEMMPSIMRTYSKIGCKILNSPHHDPDFNCIDYPVFMDIKSLDKKYSKLFLIDNGDS